MDNAKLSANLSSRSISFSLKKLNVNRYPGKNKINTDPKIILSISTMILFCRGKKIIINSKIEMIREIRISLFNFLYIRLVD